MTSLLLATQINAAVLIAANAYDLEPRLLHAIIKVESGGNPYAVGSSHGEIGLMQLRSEYHPCADFDVYLNVMCGAKYLAELRDQKAEAYPQSWWAFYNTGAYADVNPRETDYFRKVREAM